VIIQAGAFGEHQFVTARYAVRTSDYPGSHHAYAPPPLQTTLETMAVDDKWLQVQLPPASEIVLDLAMRLFQHEPGYQQPWE